MGWKIQDLILSPIHHVYFQYVNPILFENIVFSSFSQFAKIYAQNNFMMKFRKFFPSKVYPLKEFQCFPCRHVASLFDRLVYSIANLILYYGNLYTTDYEDNNGGEFKEQIKKKCYL